MASISLVKHGIEEQLMQSMGKKCTFKILQKKAREWSISLGRHLIQFEENGNSFKKQIVCNHDNL